jgi:hypothetical protein
MRVSDIASSRPAQVGGRDYHGNRPLRALSAAVADDATKRRLEALRRLAARPGTPGEGAAARAAIKRLDATLAPLAPAAPTKPLDALIGLRLKFERTGRRASCCGCDVVVVEPGSGPHVYALRCTSCSRLRDWLPKRAADLLKRLHAAGRLSMMPILRDRAVVP